MNFVKELNKFINPKEVMQELTYKTVDRAELFETKKNIELNAKYENLIIKLREIIPEEKKGILDQLDDINMQLITERDFIVYDQAFKAGFQFAKYILE